MKRFVESIVEDRFTTDYTIARAGKEIRIPATDLGFEVSDMFELAVLEGVDKTPKARRAERRMDFEEKLGALKRPRWRTSRHVKKFKIEYAMKAVDKAWRDGLGEDLKGQTVSGVIALLLPSGGSTNDSTGKIKKIKGLTLKKDRLSCICILLQIISIPMSCPSSVRWICADLHRF